MIRIYFNGDCSKCRQTLELLTRSGQEFELINYLQTPPSVQELDRLLTMLGREPQDFARKGEDRFEELGLDRHPPGSRGEWLRILVENPILIERPIVTDGKRAVLGRPPENVLTLLEEKPGQN